MTEVALAFALVVVAVQRRLGACGADTTAAMTAVLFLLLLLLLFLLPGGDTQGHCYCW